MADEMFFVRSAGIRARRSRRSRRSRPGARPGPCRPADRGELGLGLVEGVDRVDLDRGVPFVKAETIDLSVFVSSSFIVCQNVIVVVACGVAPASVRAVADGTMSMAAIAVAASANSTAAVEWSASGSPPSENVRPTSSRA